MISCKCKAWAWAERSHVIYLEFKCLKFLLIWKEISWYKIFPSINEVKITCQCKIIWVWLALLLILWWSKGLTFISWIYSCNLQGHLELKSGDLSGSGSGGGGGGGSCIQYGIIFCHPISVEKVCISLELLEINSSNTKYMKENTLLNCRVLLFTSKNCIFRKSLNFPEILYER
jgi:hypothetical protein